MAMVRVLGSFWEVKSAVENAPIRVRNAGAKRVGWNSSKTWGMSAKKLMAQRNVVMMRAMRAMSRIAVWAGRHCRVRVRRTKSLLER